MKTTGFFKRADEFGLVTKITKQTKEARSLKKTEPAMSGDDLFPTTGWSW